LGALAGFSTAVISSPAEAQQKAGAAAKPKKAAPRPIRVRTAEKARPSDPTAAPEAASSKEDAAGEERRAATAAAKPGAGESTVRAAGTKSRAESDGKPVKEEESSEGVKTYEFGAVEVEGRLRSPQILYFLRRVRAEFDAATLGHRSFLRELADTRNDPALR
jgi:hypothetical protein